MARSASWKREREGEGPSTSCVTFESAALHDEKKIDSIPAIAFVLWRALRPNSCTRKLSRAIFLSRGQGLGKKKRKKRPLSSVDFSLCILLGTEACARRAHSSLHLDDKKTILNSLSLSLSLSAPPRKNRSPPPLAAPAAPPPEAGPSASPASGASSPWASPPPREPGPLSTPRSAGRRRKRPRPTARPLLRKAPPGSRGSSPTRSWRTGTPTTRTLPSSWEPSCCCAREASRARWTPSPSSTTSRSPTSPPRR